MLYENMIWWSSYQVFWYTWCRVGTLSFCAPSTLWTRFVFIVQQVQILQGWYSKYTLSKVCVPSTASMYTLWKGGSLVQQVHSESEQGTHRRSGTIVGPPCKKVGKSGPGRWWMLHETGPWCNFYPQLPTAMISMAFVFCIGRVFGMIAECYVNTIVVQ